MASPFARTILLAAAAALSPVQVQAEPALDRPGKELPAYLECVPYARQVSGIQIYGDAWTWWNQAAGRYARGNTPRVGAVMAFEPHGNMRLGHVAAVSRVLDSRTVLLRHSNWSPIDGRRGQIEDDVRAVDVSPANDWSDVRVWYDPLQALGTTAWPVHGFIYPDRAPSTAMAPQQVAAAPAEVPVAPSKQFLKAFAMLEEAAPRPRAQAMQAAVVKKVGGPQPTDLLAQLRR